MPAVPSLSGRKITKTFEALGWEVARQRGSHIILVKENHPATLSVPNHKAVARGTLRGLIRAAGISVETFIKAARTSKNP